MMPLASTGHLGIAVLPAADTHPTSDLLFAQFGRALVEQVRSGDAERDPVTFVARWVSVVRELDGGL